MDHPFFKQLVLLEPVFFPELLVDSLKFIRRFGWDQNAMGEGLMFFLSPWQPKTSTDEKREFWIYNLQP